MLYEGFLAQEPAEDCLLVLFSEHVAYKRCLSEHNYYLFEHLLFGHCVKAEKAKLAIPIGGCRSSASTTNKGTVRNRALKAWLWGWGGRRKGPTS